MIEDPHKTSEATSSEPASNSYAGGQKTVVHKESWAPAVKWIAICLTMFMFTLILYQTYRIVTAPVRGLGTAIESVRGGAEAMATRLDVDLDKPKTFSQLSEEAFAILNAYPVKQARNWDESIYWMQNLRGSNSQVCRFTVDFGDGPIKILTAANNDDYATAKSVGSLQDRIIRVHIVTEGRQLGLRSYWDDESKVWKMRWRRLTFSKPLNDAAAQNTLYRILNEIPVHCVE